MYRQARRNLSWIAMILCSTAVPVNAEIMTFTVNLSGVDAPSGHTLKVFGTISVDPALPVSTANTSSCLQFQHHNYAAIDLPSSPGLFAAPPTALAWSFVAGDLYISRIDTYDSSFGWQVFPGPRTVRLELGTGSIDHRLVDLDPSLGSTPTVFLATLKPASGPDGPTGLLFGTAIPEPSSASLLAAVGAVFSMLRWRRS